jgi:hypothetical protein
MLFLGARDARETDGTEKDPGLRIIHLWRPRKHLVTVLV